MQRLVRARYQSCHATPATIVTTQRGLIEGEMSTASPRGGIRRNEVTHTTTQEWVPASALPLSRPIFTVKVSQADSVLCRALTKHMLTYLRCFAGRKFWQQYLVRIGTFGNFPRQESATTCTCHPRVRLWLLKEQFLPSTAHQLWRKRYL
jgi:hypothetical protein